MQIADMDRGYYATHALTLARHPSETDERMMVRLLAFAMYAHEHLAFGRGLSTQDEADLWQKDLTGAIERWIDVGLPDERDIRRACNKAKSVNILCYGGRGADLWWSQNRSALTRLDNLGILDLPYENTQALARLAARTMRIQCNIQEGQITMIDGTQLVLIEPAVLQAPAQIS